MRKYGTRVPALFCFFFSLFLAVTGFELDCRCRSRIGGLQKIQRGARAVHPVDMLKKHSGPITHLQHFQHYTTCVPYGSFRKKKHRTVLPPRAASGSTRLHQGNPSTVINMHCPTFTIICAWTTYLQYQLVAYLDPFFFTHTHTSTLAPFGILPQQWRPEVTN